MLSWLHILLALSVWMITGYSARADFQGSSHLVSIENPPIKYGQTQASNLVSELQARLDQGETSLVWNSTNGYLNALLKELLVSPASQLLVGSKTSLQKDFISPLNPRAVFFNEAVYLGWIPGAPLIEIAAVDSKLGSVFYTLDQNKSGKAKLIRNDQCLECHASGKTVGVPGLLMRSMPTNTNGLVNLITGISPVTHRTPVHDRWGGWYVTGAPKNLKHLGNRFDGTNSNPSPKALQTVPSANPERGYPAGTSDVTALMVFEHQAHLHNLLTRIRFESVSMLQQYGHLNYLSSPIEAVVKYLLFSGEAALETPVVANPSFQSWFRKNAVTDRQGRSLRDFDLKTRLFKFRCSFLIYDPSFDSMPEPAQQLVFKRLNDILQGRDQSADYAHLLPDERQAIHQILMATKPGYAKSDVNKIAAR